MAYQRILIRWQLVAVGLTLAVVVSFLVVFQPLVHRSHALDLELEGTWGEFATLNQQTGRSLRLESVDETRRQVEAAVEALDQAEASVYEHFRLSPETQGHLKEDFDSLAFNKVRRDRREKLRDTAAERGVDLAFISGSTFPVQSATVDNPNLLWGEMELVYHAVALAVAHEFQAVEQVDVLDRRPHGSAGGPRVDWHEYPIHLKLVGSMESTLRFLVNLPLAPGEMEAIDYPRVEHKPPLLVERLLIKRASPEPEEVQVELILSGFLRQSNPS